MEKKCSYIDETIVEEESSEAGVNARVGRLRLLDYGSNDRRHVRARGVVEGGAQLSL